MGYKTVAQILKQADDLKVRISRPCDLLNDSNAWSDQQKLQTIYHQALVLDLEYALDKKVEQDLWNIGFKNYISTLQELARDKKNSRRSDYQALLTWCLETASGYYITLLQDLCNTFDIDLPFRRRGTVFGQIGANTVTDQINLPQKSSCLYVCQYCLVHLGDIARYRNQRKQAESFYKQAIIVSPTSGHPYNQLALLEASQGDKLSTVYYYVRAISLKNPFPASTTNLISVLNTAIDKESHSDKIQTKLTSNEFIQLYLCAQGYLQTATDLSQAELAVKSLNSTMTALVATQSFSTSSLIKMTAINLYTLQRVSNEELTDDEKKVRQLVLDLIAGSLSAFLVPVHTLKLDEGLLDYYALPAVKLLLYFIQSQPNLLRESVFTNRMQIWPSLCKLLNNVQKTLKQLNYNKYLTTPLMEDKCLHGFSVFSKCFKEFDFKEEIEDQKIEKLIRCRRISNISVGLTELEMNDGNKLIVKNEVNGESVFEPGCTQPDPTNDLLEEMKSFCVNEIDVVRKAGILKPQGSLEKSREERENQSNEGSVTKSNEGIQSVASVVNTNKTVIDPLKIKRSKQNVALQSIFKKMEENKQVKFNVAEETEKSVKFESKPLIQKQFRTQSFNQNHPAFPPPTQQPPPPQPTHYLNREKPVPPPPPNYNFPPPQPPQSKIDNSKSNRLPFTSHPPPPMNQFNNPPPPYQNIFPPPPSNPYNTWKRDDQPWWPNQNYQQQQQQRPPPPSATPDYPMNFLNNGMQYPIHKGGGEIYHQHSPWNNNSNFLRNEGGNFEQSMSMRQAMLKEANLPQTPVNRLHTVTSPNLSQNSQGSYSLFNTNSWTPNLGQLRNNNKSDNNSQQSLFGGHGPQSLAQLLEQQSQLHKND